MFVKFYGTSFMFFLDELPCACVYLVHQDLKNIEKWLFHLCSLVFYPGVVMQPVCVGVPIITGHVSESKKHAQCIVLLGGGFKDCLFSSLLKDMIYLI